MAITAGENHSYCVFNENHEGWLPRVVFAWKPGWLILNVWFGLVSTFCTCRCGVVHEELAGAEANTYEFEDLIRQRL